MTLEQFKVGQRYDVVKYNEDYGNNCSNNNNNKSHNNSKRQRIITFTDVLRASFTTSDPV